MYGHKKSPTETSLSINRALRSRLRSTVRFAPQRCRFLLKQQKKSGDFLFLRSFSTFSIKQLWFVFQPLFAKFLQLLAFFVDGLLQLLLLLAQIGQFL